MPINRIAIWWYSVSTSWGYPKSVSKKNAAGQIIQFPIPIVLRGYGDGYGSARVPVYYEVEDSNGLGIANGMFTGYFKYQSEKVIKQAIPARPLVAGETVLVKVFANGTTLSSDAIYAKLVVDDKWIKVTGDEYNYSGSNPTSDLVTTIPEAEPVVTEPPVELPVPIGQEPEPTTNPNTTGNVPAPIPPDIVLYTGVPTSTTGTGALPPTSTDTQPNQGGGKGLALLIILGLGLAGLG